MTDKLKTRLSLMPFDEEHMYQVSGYTLNRLYRYKERADQFASIDKRDLCNYISTIFFEEIITDNS